MTQYGYFSAEYAKQHNQGIAQLARIADRCAITRLLDSKPKRRVSMPKKKSRNGPNQTSFYLWGIPKPIKKKFKAVCAKEGVSMTKKLIRLMEQI